MQRSAAVCRCRELRSQYSVCFGLVCIFRIPVCKDDIESIESRAGYLHCWKRGRDRVGTEQARQQERRVLISDFAAHSATIECFGLSGSRSLNVRRERLVFGATAMLGRIEVPEVVRIEWFNAGMEPSVVMGSRWRVRLVGLPSYRTLEKHRRWHWYRLLIVRCKLDLVLV